MAEGVPLKESALNRQRVGVIAAELAAVWSGFDADGFVGSVMGQLPHLELKARVACVADNLAAFLPARYSDAVDIIVSALPRHDDRTFHGPDFGIYTYAPYSDFVARHGCTRAALQTSLRALPEMTKHFSAEDALRYFLNAFPDETMAAVLQWSRDADYHVRRLASEGTRPLLPWSPRIEIPFATMIPVLDNLFADRHRFVTTSVANHLNDISRIDPGLVLSTLTRWRAAGAQSAAEMAFIAKQSLRTLIKQGYPAAFTYFGLSSEPAARVLDLTLDSTVIAVGDPLTFSFVIASPRDESVLIDYVIRHPRRSPPGYGESVYKLKSVDLRAGQKVAVTKTRPMRSTATRRLTPGGYELFVQVNGNRLAHIGFHVK
ncbi:hypothetical protein NDR87_13990 [Nocardia sp. CDC159]|uniref:3-methyladenine DNA glycosylase AlkC n=1 Tax=Nocardia pulmonis TaxID=2951408 RepID=A0A9X2E9U0_9NOCA|nr:MULTISPECIES: hypothetical protein [Nocardia]MCM6774466.1 hypothetical protein [Nocardia pulmonis]MCM6787468.1 hypothetical protein [Nocardia sp. CDC159]